MSSEYEDSSSEIESINENDFRQTILLSTSKNFVNEINDFILNSKSSNNDTVEEALQLNKKMQEMLIEMKSTLEILYRKCRLKYKYNEDIMNSKKPKEKFLCRNYNFCGIPFFKTPDNYSAPPNEDYIMRKTKYNEIFPADLLLHKQTYWSLKDKVSVIHGVKQQVLEHLSSKKRYEPSTSLTQEANQITQSSEKLSKLLSQCDKNFKISWYRVSTEFVNQRFSEKSCEAMWNMYLKPGINRNAWTEEENKKLGEAALENNFQNWDKIAETLGNRSKFQCFVQYYTVVVHQNENRKVNKWTPEDDEKLLKVVKKCRMNNFIRWDLVKNHFPHLSKKQLHHRYQYSIDPNINKSRFTPEEDCAILAAIERYGENFQSFPLGLFCGRTIVQIRNRWHNTLKFSGMHSVWSVEEDKKLVDLIKEHGVGNWSLIASHFNNKSRSSIRQRHLTIKKFFEKNPDSSIEFCPRKKMPLRTEVTKDNWQEKIHEHPINQTEDGYSYYNTLRNLEKKYYQYFKFSYDYKFDEEPIRIYNPVSNLNMLVNYFDLKIFKNIKSQSFQKKFSHYDYSLLMKVVQSKKAISKKITPVNGLPPSWSTLLGFRGICIQCASIIHTRPEEERILKKQDKITEIDAKNLFRKRFHMLFYKTALLSRLEYFISHEILLANSDILERLPQYDVNNDQKNPNEFQSYDTSNDQSNLNQNPNKRRILLSEIEGPAKHIKQEY